VEDAVEAKTEIRKRRGNDKFYVLAEGVEFFTMTKEARELCSTVTHLDNVFAIAFYTKNISILLLGEIYNKINKPPVPTKVFTNKDEARDWLNEQRIKNGHPDF
ncbi:MAG: hypothetical protein K0S12_439, partial [Bacteroidetes bacterium]|nr:hypothetical protein [Bacteroidota bacterium]